MPEGAFRIETAAGETPAITITGGPFSGTIYGAEELIQRLANPIDGGFDLPAGTIEDAPDLTYRTWWNWDHSTNWDLEQIGVQEIGVMNPYAKPADGFLADFRRLVDFMSRNRIAAIAIYGFLRESHGGIEAAQELCRYATERGVRILPGVAINAYGGIVWEMEHDYIGDQAAQSSPCWPADGAPHRIQIQVLVYIYISRGATTHAPAVSQPANQDCGGYGSSWALGIVRFWRASYRSPVITALRLSALPGFAAPNGRTPDAETAMPKSWSSRYADSIPAVRRGSDQNTRIAWIIPKSGDKLMDAEAMAPLRHMPRAELSEHPQRSYWNRVDRDLPRLTHPQLPTSTNVCSVPLPCKWCDRRTEALPFNGRDWPASGKKAKATGRGLERLANPPLQNTRHGAEGSRLFPFDLDSTLDWERGSTAISHRCSAAPALPAIYGHPR